MNNTSRTTDLPVADPGYFYDPTVVAGQHGEIKLSPRVEGECRCGGVAPYQVFDADDLEPRWCACRRYRQKIRQVNRCIAQSDIPLHYQFKFQADFLDTYGGRPVSGARELRHYLLALLDKFTMSLGEGTDGIKPSGQPQPRGFLLWGPPGNGKTLLCCIALNELMFRSGLPGKFIGISREFFQKLRHTFDENSETRGQAVPYLDTLSKVPFLLIDDLGIQRDSPWEVEMLYNLIDARYTGHRLTFVTTNKPFDQLKDLADGRIHSRFKEMCRIINVQGDDFRDRLKEKEVNL